MTIGFFFCFWFHKTPLTSTGFDWTPSAEDERLAAEWMRQLTDGAERKRALDRQLPAHDLDPARCTSLSTNKERQQSVPDSFLLLSRSCGPCQLGRGNLVFKWVPLGVLSSILLGCGLWFSWVSLLFDGGSRFLGARPVFSCDRQWTRDSFRDCVFPAAADDAGFYRVLLLLFQL